MSYGFTKLFGSIITSSIWAEDNVTRIVWITMLAIADEDGYVSGSIPGLANIARFSIDETRNAIEKLKGPDEYSRTKEHEGRRIAEVDGGWLILNYGMYRDRARVESRRAYIKNYMRERRKHSEFTAVNKELTQVNSSASVSASEYEGESQREETPLDHAFDGIIQTSLKTDKFLAAWHLWIKDRRARRKPVTCHAAAMQLKKLEAMGEAKAVEAIETAIERGWTGLFRVDDAKQGDKPGLRFCDKCRLPVSSCICNRVEEDDQ